MQQLTNTHMREDSYYIIMYDIFIHIRAIKHFGTHTFHTTLFSEYMLYYASGYGVITRSAGMETGSYFFAYYML